MPGTNASIPPVRITAELPSAWSSSLGSEAIQILRRGTESYAQEIVKDLHLETVQFALKNAPERNSPFSVTINGQKCRLPFRSVTQLSSLSDPVESARLIGRIIHENRMLLISAEIASAWRGSWSPLKQGLFLPELSRIALLEYLCLLAQGCFHIGRSTELDAPFSSANRSRSFDQGKRLFPETPQEYHELVAAPLSNLRCILYRSPGDGKSATSQEQSIMQRLGETRERVFLDLGVRVPFVQLDEDEALREPEFRFQINDVRLPPQRGLGKSEFLVDMDPRRLGALGLAGQPAQNPATGAPATILNDPSAAEQARAKRLAVMDRERYMLEACHRELRRYAGLFVVAEGVEHELDLLRPWYSDIVSATERRFGTPAIAYILRNLVAEGFSVRDLPGVLEAMLSAKAIQHLHADGRKSVIEAVRFRMRDYMLYKSARGYEALPIYRVGEDIEEMLKEGHVKEHERLAIGKAIWEGIRKVTFPPPVIVTRSSVRGILGELIEIELPGAVVLSNEEIGDMRTQTLGRISLQTTRQP